MASGNAGESVKALFQTERSDWVFVILATLVFFSALVITTWDFVKAQEMVFRMGAINVAGIALFIVGVTIRMVGRLTLGRYYSYGLRTLRDHRLIKYGIYKYVRHPISLAAIIYDLGIPLVFSSLYGFIMMLALIPLILYRTKIEESMLIERFGEEYIEYMKRTKKFIPLVY